MLENVLFGIVIVFIIGVMVCSFLLVRSVLQTADTKAPYDIFDWVKEYGVREVRAEAGPDSDGYRDITFYFHDDPTNKPWGPSEFVKDAQIIMDLYRALQFEIDQPDGARIGPRH